MSITIQQIKRQKSSLTKFFKNDKRRPNASQRVIDENNKVFNSQTEYAESIGRTPQAVSAALKKGKLPVPKDESLEKTRFTDDNGDEWDSLYAFCKYHGLNFRKSYYNVNKGRSATHGQEKIAKKMNEKRKEKNERIQRQIDAEIYMEKTYGLNGQSSIYNGLCVLEVDDMDMLDTSDKDLQDYLKMYDV